VSDETKVTWWEKHVEAKQMWNRTNGER